MTDDVEAMRAELEWYRAREAKLIEYAAGRSDVLSVILVDHLTKGESLSFDNGQIDVVTASDGIPPPWWAQVDRLAADQNYETLAPIESVFLEAIGQKTLVGALADTMDAEAQRILRQALRNLRSGERGPDGELWESRFERVVAALIAHYGERTPEKDDNVLVEDRHSGHYGKTGLVAFVKEGRVYVSISDPRSIAGHVMESFLPEKVRVLPTRYQAEASERAAVERRASAKILQENVLLTENLSSTQERCGALLLAARGMREKILELGGEDPGAP